jgi:hypothetical protein
VASTDMSGDPTYQELGHSLRVIAARNRVATACSGSPPAGELNSALGGTDVPEVPSRVPHPGLEDGLSTSRSPPALAISSVNPFPFFTFSITE